MQQVKLYDKLELPEYQFIDSPEEIKLQLPINLNPNIPPAPPLPQQTINPIYQKYFKMKSRKRRGYNCMRV